MMLKICTCLLVHGSASGLHRNGLHDRRSEFFGRCLRFVRVRCFKIVHLRSPESGSGKFALRGYREETELANASAPASRTPLVRSQHTLVTRNFSGSLVSCPLGREPLWLKNLSPLQSMLRSLLAIKNVPTEALCRSMHNPLL